MKVANPKYLRNAQTRLAVLQRRLDRKQKGSQNRNKARLKVARCHQKIADQRKDFQHQLSSRLVRENQALAVESLNVDGMVKNPSLARAISDAGWGTFLAMLAYKCQEAGKPLLRRSGMFEPSSKTCSVCGYRKADLTLKDRAWTCPDCGTTHDRDLNAAINIKHFALARRRIMRRRACGLAPDGEGDEAGSPLRKRGVVHPSYPETGARSSLLQSGGEQAMSGSLDRWHVTKPGQTVMSIFWSTWILTGVFLMSGVSRWISPSSSIARSML
jgi:putative transposase